MSKFKIGDEITHPLWKGETRIIKFYDCSDDGKEIIQTTKPSPKIEKHGLSLKEYFDLIRVI